MRIISFDFDSGLGEASAALRYRLYAEDPLWIPPPPQHVLRAYQPDFGFYAGPRNRHRHFVALDGDTVTGHVSALVNAEMQGRHGPDLGLIGLFECEDDPITAAALIEAATEWLRREHAIVRIWAPVNFDIWHEYRFRTKGHETVPFFGEPYNPPAYPEAFVRCGFRPLEMWETVDVNSARVRAALKDLDAPRVLAKVLAAGWRIEHCNPQCDRDVIAMYAVETATLAPALGFTPPQLDEYRRIFRDHGDVAGTRFMTLLRAPDGTPAGLIIAYTDPGDALRAAWRHEKALSPATVAGSGRRAVLYFVGVLAEEQGHRSALAMALGSRTLEWLLEAGHDTITFALLSSGSRARAFLGSALHEVRSEHRLFEKYPA